MKAKNTKGEALHFLTLADWQMPQNKRAFPFPDMEKVLEYLELCEKKMPFS